MLKDIVSLNNDLGNPEKVSFNPELFNLKEIGKLTLARFSDKILKKHIKNKNIFNFIRYFILNNGHRYKKSHFNIYVINDEWIVLEKDNILYIRYNIKNIKLIINSIYSVNNPNGFFLINEFHDILILDNNVIVNYYFYENNKISKEGVFNLDLKFNFLENLNSNIFLKTKNVLLKEKMYNFKKYFSLKGNKENKEIYFIKTNQINKKYICYYLLHCNIINDLEEDPFIQVINKEVLIYRRKNLGIFWKKNKIIKNLIENDYINYKNIEEKDIGIIELNTEK